MTFLTSFARNKELAIHQLACAVVVHIARGQLSAGLKDILVNEKSTPIGVLMKGMVALLPVSMTRWTEAIGNQTAARIRQLVFTQVNRFQHLESAQLRAQWLNVAIVQSFA